MKQQLLILKIYFIRSVKLLLSVLPFVFLIVVLAIGVRRFLPTNDTIRVALVAEEQEALTEIFLSSITQAHANLELLPLTDVKAATALKEGQVACVIRLPSNSSLRLAKGESLNLDVEFGRIPSPVRQRLSTYLNQLIDVLNTAQNQTELRWHLLALQNKLDPEQLNAVFPTALKKYSLAFLARSEILAELFPAQTSTFVDWDNYYLSALLVAGLVLLSQLLAQNLGDDWRFGIAERLRLQTGKSWSLFVFASLSQVSVLTPFTFLLLWVSGNARVTATTFLMATALILILVFINNGLAVLLSQLRLAPEVQLVFNLVLILFSGLVIPLPYWGSLINRLGKLSPLNQFHQHLLYEKAFILWPFLLFMLAAWLFFAYARQKQSRGLRSRGKKNA